MTLPKHQEFTTDDPDVLAKELALEHEDIREEFAELGTVRPAQRSVVPTLPIVAAAPYDSIVCLTFDLTVRPPANAEPGQRFSVVRASTGNVTVAPDDGTLVQGAASDVLNIAGFREYEFQAGGWWASV